MTSLNHARIVALIREDLNYTVEKTTIDQEIAEIWLKVGDTRNNSLLIGGCYRQHHILGRYYSASSRLDVQKEQETRWEKYLRKLKRITRNKRAIVLGDFNLDHLRWESPEPHLSKMVDDTKNIIEYSGYIQLVKKYTRTWRGQADSLLDQIWTNCPQTTIKIFNIERGASDHNVVGVEMSTKDLQTGGQNSLRRCWKKFDRKRCQDKFRNTDWTEVLSQTDARIAASLLEELICSVIDTEAPLKLIQHRAGFKSWVSENTKAAMADRDIARTKAKESDSDLDWSNYKMKRNNCTKLLRKDKTASMKLSFDKIENENDNAKTI